MDSEPTPWTLDQLQSYVTAVEIRKGHICDNIKTKCLILMEELGELAKALRIFLKMRTHSLTAVHSLEDEFGDVLFLLIAIANRAGVNLTQALINKIEKDEEKIYKAADTHAPANNRHA
jgi:NTP pyrophosphatase (non-canonical NTP hydrolase)